MSISTTKKTFFVVEKTRGSVGDVKSLLRPVPLRRGNGLTNRNLICTDTLDCLRPLLCVSPPLTDIDESLNRLEFCFGSY